MGNVNVGSIFYDLNLDDAQFKTAAVDDKALAGELGATLDKTTAAAMELGPAAAASATEAGAAVETAGGMAAGARDTFGELGKSMIESLAPLVAIFGAYEGTKDILKSANDATNEWNNALVQVNNTLKQSNGAISLSSEKIQSMAEEFSKSTPITKGAQLQGEAILLTYKAIGEKTFPQVAKILPDVATAFANVQGRAVASSGDVAQAAKKLGVALTDPAVGVNALTRAGIKFTAQQQEVIKTLQKSGDVTGAQTQLLSDFADMTAGKATASLNTYQGAVANAKKQFDDYVGNGIRVAQKALESLGKVLENVGIYIVKHKILMEALTGAAVALAIIGFGALLWAIIGAIAGFIALDAAALPWIALAAAIGAAAVLLVENWNTVVRFMKGDWGQALTGFLVLMMPWIGIPLEIAEHWSTLSTFFVNMWHDINDTFRRSVGDVENWYNDTLAIFDQAWSDIKQWTDDIVAIFMWPWDEMIKIVHDFRTNFWGTLSNAFDQVLTDIYNFGTKTIPEWASVLGSWLDAIYDWAKTVPGALYQDFLDIGKDIVNAVGDGITSLGNDLKKFGEYLLTKIEEGWDDSISTVKGWASELYGRLEEGWNDISETAKSLGSTLLGWVKGGWDTVSRDVPQWADDLGHDLKIGFDRVKANAPQWGKDIVKGIETGLKDLAKWDWTQVKQWGKDWEGYGKDAVQWGTDIINGIKGGFDTASRDTEQWGKDIIKGVKTGFDTAVRNTIQWGKDIINDVKKGFDIAVKDVTQWGKDIINGVKKGFDQSVRDTVQWGKDIVTNAKKGFEQAVSDTVQWGKDIIHGITKGLSQTVSDIVNFFKSLPKTIERDVFNSGSQIADTHHAGVKSGWTDVNKMKQIGDAILKGIAMAFAAVIAAILLLAVSVGIAMINGIVHGVSAAIGAIGTAMSWIYQHVTSAVSGAGNWLYQTGKDIISGIIHGVEDAVGGIGGAIGKIGKNIGGAVSSALHAIHIPGFASGVQNFSGGLAVVGELGPELVDLPPGSSVIPNNKLGGGQGGTNTGGNTVYNIDKVQLTTAGAVQEFFGIGNRNTQLESVGMSPLAGTTRT